ncbi:uncharacterized protein K460DRAFT_350859 [Cucurbitaria berberidis CBS 394.84]|uniref:Uncharacterized protein n=1 Tax=Cucurbitaria berberidis CBS 394.84 TaxID=1168544 RepID=A0A9P4GQP5_9PLEO|nr:uncharacterized protein K460DRAFT_350859 [Cucurbitaria berberidis CBS 394.84]KAF1850858.1 hypothetical protein K460DRAFT_350859 [Cucurbitaria berberidis CBS 394.84]
MSFTNNMPTASAIEETIANAIPTTTSTEYATKADFERLERELAELKASHLEIKTLLQQLLAARTGQDITRSDYVYNAPAHDTPNGDTQVSAADRTSTPHALESQSVIPLASNPEVARTVATPILYVTGSLGSVQTQQATNSSQTAPDAAPSHTQPAMPRPDQHRCCDTSVEGGVPGRTFIELSDSDDNIYFDTPATRARQGPPRATTNISNRADTNRPGRTCMQPTINISTTTNNSPGETLSPLNAQRKRGADAQDAGAPDWAVKQAQDIRNRDQLREEAKRSRRN